MNTNTQLELTLSTPRTFDKFDEDNLIQIKEQMEQASKYGWVFLFTARHAKGCVNLMCTPNLDLEWSLMSRWSPYAYDGFRILTSVYVEDRRQAFEYFRDQTNSIATKALSGSEKHQWFEMRAEKAVAVLHGIA